jgi:HEAT repeat protein
MANFGDYKKVAVPVLVHSLGGPNQREEGVRGAIYGALGKLGDDLALYEVHKGFKDDRVNTAKAAVAAAGEMRRKASVQLLVDLLGEIEVWIKRKQGGGYEGRRARRGPASNTPR